MWTGIDFVPFKGVNFRCYFEIWPDEDNKTYIDGVYIEDGEVNLFEALDGTGIIEQLEDYLDNKYNGLKIVDPINALKD